MYGPFGLLSLFITYCVSLIIYEDGRTCEDIQVCNLHSLADSILVRLRRAIPRWVSFYVLSFEFKFGSSYYVPYLTALHLTRNWNTCMNVIKWRIILIRILNWALSVTHWDISFYGLKLISFDKANEDFRCFLARKSRPFGLIWWSIERLMSEFILKEIIKFKIQKEVYLIKNENH